MRVTLVQNDILWNEPAANVAQCNGLIAQSLDTQSLNTKDPGLLIFPEMFTTGFSLATGELAKQAEDAGRAFLSDLATRTGSYCIGSTPETDASGRVFNTAWVYGPSGLLGSYRKIHLFSFGAEHTTYSPGESLLSLTLGTLRCTIFICYDLRFPPPFAMAAKITDLFIVIANWPAARRDHWLTLLRSRAIENQALVAGVNRTGDGGGLTYSGDSVIFDPAGAPVVTMGNETSAVTVDVDPAIVAEARNTFPTLRDRRPVEYLKIREYIASL